MQVLDASSAKRLAKPFRGVRRTASPLCEFVQGRAGMTPSYAADTYPITPTARSSPAIAITDNPAPT